SASGRTPVLAAARRAPHVRWRPCRCSQCESGLRYRDARAPQETSYRGRLKTSAAAGKTNPKTSMATRSDFVLPRVRRVHETTNTAASAGSVKTYSLTSRYRLQFNY
ncbi:unnamed protein product, partial [Ectocarpus sp. 12 AP-2014]